MKQQTVYVPVKNETKVYFDLDISLKDYLNACAEIENDIYTPVDTFIIGDNNIYCVGALKRAENANIFTDAELLELKKKWCEEAFDKGSENPYKFGSSPTFINTSRDFHKQTFLNSIKLD